MRRIDAFQPKTFKLPKTSAGVLFGTQEAGSSPTKWKKGSVEAGLGGEEVLMFCQS